MRGMAIFEKFMLVFGSLVLLGMLMPLLSSLSNRILGQRTTQIKSFKLIELEARSEQPYGILDSALVQVDGHLAKVQMDDGMTSFYLKKDLKYKHSVDSIFLPMRRGFWGFNYIDLQSR